VIGRSGDAAAQARVVELLAGMGSESARFQMAASLISEGALSEPVRAGAAWRSLMGSAAERAKAIGEPVPDAIRLLPESGSSAVGTALRHLGRVGLPENRSAVLAILGRLPGREWAPRLTAGWSELAPGARPALVTQLVRRPETARVLVDALEQGLVPATEVDLGSVAALRGMGDSALRARVRALFGDPPVPRGAAIEAYLPALRLAGNAAHGAVVFAGRCAACHRLGGTGSSLGPDLASVRSNGREKILVSILDPNREVSPAFVAWSAETSDGSSWSGILVREDAASVVLKGAGGTETALARSDLKRLSRSDRSLMPEGLEGGLSQQDFADLLEYVIIAR
jgi:putative heme-binding domain-containing protein